MKKTPLTRALWTCLEAEACLQELQTTLTALRQYIAQEQERKLVDLVDEFYAVQSRVQAVKHDLIICIRKSTENRL